MIMPSGRHSGCNPWEKTHTQFLAGLFLSEPHPVPAPPDCKEAVVWQSASLSPGDGFLGRTCQPAEDTPTRQASRYWSQGDHLGHATTSWVRWGLQSAEGNAWRGGEQLPGFHGVSRVPGAGASLGRRGDHGLQVGPRLFLYQPQRGGGGALCSVLCPQEAHPPGVGFGPGLRLGVWT